MKYSDKKKRDDLFRSSLNELLIFAYNTPALSLNERRALVMTIYDGGDFEQKEQESTFHYSSDYNYTRQGLIRICLDKMVSCPELTQNVTKAIGKISALSAWAILNPNRTGEIIDSFAKKMCPEDYSEESTQTIIDSIRNNLRKNLVRRYGEKTGRERYLDLMTSPSSFFYKKYRGK